jgi:ubiquinone/menaquinone biosynthesis C-methylase UbiE
MADPRAKTVRDGYANVATAYADELGDELAGKPLDRALLTAFAEQVGPGIVVDVGCGPGHIGAFVASHRGHVDPSNGDSCRVEGIDLSPDMIAVASARYPRLAFRTADMFALPYADNSVAGIVAFYAIVHLQTPELGGPLREFHRVLAPGGLALIAFHAGDQTVHVDELFGRTTSLDFTFHPRDAVVAAVAAAGLSIEARLDRKPYPNAEHPSDRTYLLARKR